METVVRRFAAVQLCLLAVACARDGGPVEASGSETLLAWAAGQPFEVKIGESVKLGIDGVTVSFHAVPSDSRCPADVNCVWDGDAVVELGFRSEGVRREVELHSEREPRQASIGDYLLMLEELRPVPHAGAAPASGDYVAVLRVTAR
jgi:hypothetical protein